MARVFSGIQPSGDVHLGNLLGALRNWVRDQDAHDATYCVVDLHAVTTPAGAIGLRDATLKLSQMLMAVGIDPERATLFVQSHVREHAELAWLLQCNVAFGELRRMTQFKDKSDGADFVSAALFTYPALQAADVLLYDTEKVPVGDDQRQHIELTRDIAERYNSRYGQTFVIPEHVIPTAGARIMDLQEPTTKMSKSAGDAPGTIWLLDPPATIAKKIRRAVTDSDDAVFYDPSTKAGVSNLLDILGAVTGRDPVALADDYDRYGPLKADCAEAVVELLTPVQDRFTDLAADPGETQRLLNRGADRARERAAVTVARAKANLGFLDDGA